MSGAWDTPPYLLGYHKNSKNWDTIMIIVIVVEVEQYGFTLPECIQKGGDGIAKGVDPRAREIDKCQSVHQYSKRLAISDRIYGNIRLDVYV